MPNNRRAFRLRFGDGRFAPAPFLRLCAFAPLTRSPNRRPKLALITLSHLKAAIPVS